ncbi:hypothetical protein LINGRAHAP2_LOCUS31509, partial [Linum grandiflorum]
DLNKVLGKRLLDRFVLGQVHRQRYYTSEEPIRSKSLAGQSVRIAIPKVRGEPKVNQTYFFCHSFDFT